MAGLAGHAAGEGGAGPTLGLRDDIFVIAGGQVRGRHACAIFGAAHARHRNRLVKARRAQPPDIERQIVGQGLAGDADTDVDRLAGNGGIGRDHLDQVGIGLRRIDVIFAQADAIYHGRQGGGIDVVAPSQQPHPGFDAECAAAGLRRGRRAVGRHGQRRDVKRRPKISQLHRHRPVAEIEPRDDLAQLRLGEGIAGQQFVGIDLQPPYPVLDLVEEIGAGALIVDDRRRAEADDAGQL